MKKIDDPIKELTNRIQAHILKGGSIYDPRRQLKYYEYLRNVKARLSKMDGIEYTNADIYQFCGFDYDPYYAIYLEMLSDLSELSDKDKYVDKKFSFKTTKPETYGKLCTLATAHNSCLYDTIVILTGYRLKDANINMDYEQALIERLLIAYPDRNIAGIRRNNTNLYEMIRHLKEYKYPTMSMAETIGILGFTNSRMKNETEINISKTELLSTLNRLYPSKVIDRSLFQQKDFYYKLIKLSILENLSLVEYLNKLGFSYTQGNMVARLAQMKVDESKRYNFLIKKKKEFYSKLDTSSLTDKDEYYLNLQLLDEIAKIDNVQSFVKDDSFKV